MAKKAQETNQPKEDDKDRELTKADFLVPNFKETPASEKVKASRTRFKRKPGQVYSTKDEKNRTPKTDEDDTTTQESGDGTKSMKGDRLDGGSEPTDKVLDENQKNKFL